MPGTSLFSNHGYLTDFWTNTNSGEQRGYLTDITTSNAERNGGKTSGVLDVKTSGVGSGHLQTSFVGGRGRGTDDPLDEFFSNVKKEIGLSDEDSSADLSLGHTVTDLDRKIKNFNIDQAQFLATNEADLQDLDEKLSAMKTQVSTLVKAVEDQGSVMDSVKDAFNQLKGIAEGLQTQ